jgi:hypothetical protein
MGQMTLRDPREQPMRQHRPIDHDRHSRIMLPTRHDASPAITHQLVRRPPDVPVDDQADDESEKAS